MAIKMITGGSAPSSLPLTMGKPGEQTNETADSTAWFDRIVAQKQEIDPEIAQSFRNNRDFYFAAASIAKAYMTTTNEPFSPLQPANGQYGVKEITPQDIGIITWSSQYVATSTLHTWVQSFSPAASVNWVNLFGTPSVAVAPSNTSSYHSLLAWHGMISYQPGTRLQQLQQNVGSYTYPTTSVEEAAKIDKTFKKFKLIPLEAPYLLIPTNTWYAQASLQKVVFTNAEGPYTEEIALLGLVFAEYSYLRSQIS